MLTRKVLNTQMKKRSRQNTATDRKSTVDPDNDWNDDTTGSEDEWLELTVRERDSSRVRRQMEARRKLEQLMEAKRLRRLVDDWDLADEPRPGAEPRR
jgi:hypothetical protein